MFAKSSRRKGYSVNRESLKLVADFYDQAIRLFEMSRSWELAAEVYEKLVEQCEDLNERNEMLTFASRRRARAARAWQDGQRCFDLIGMHYEGMRILN